MHAELARCQNHDYTNVAIKESGLAVEISRSANRAASKPMKDTKQYWWHRVPAVERYPMISRFMQTKKYRKHKSRRNILPARTKSVWQIYCVKHSVDIEENHGVGIYCGLFRFVWSLTQVFSGLNSALDHWGRVQER